MLINIYWWKPFIVSNHFVVFGGYSSGAIGYVKYLICCVTSRNHVIGGSSNFINGDPWWYVTILPILVGIGIAVIDMFLVCHGSIKTTLIKGDVTIIMGAPQVC